MFKFRSGASHFSWLLLRCFYTLTGVCLWLNKILDMIWKATHLFYRRPHSWHCILYQSKWNCLQSSQIMSRQRSRGKQPKSFFTEVSQEYSGLHISQMEEVWKKQDSSKSWSSGQTAQSGEKGLNKRGAQEPDGHDNWVPQIMSEVRRKFQKDSHLCRLPTMWPLWKSD